MSAESKFKFCLGHYDDVVQAIEEKRLDPNVPKQGGNGSGKCRISDPTAMLAIRNTMEVDFVDIPYGPVVNGYRETFHLERPQSWLRVVESTKRTFRGQIQWDLVFLRYAEQKEIADIVEALHISPALYHTILNNVLSFAKGVATGLGLVRFNTKK